MNRINGMDKCFNNMFYIILICQACLYINTVCLVYSLKTPDYDSMWLPIASNTVGNDKIKVNHELGEIPLIVDVQVKSKDTPNEDYIFQAVGKYEDYFI